MFSFYRLVPPSEHLLNSVAHIRLLGRNRVWEIFSVLASQDSSVPLSLSCAHHTLTPLRTLKIPCPPLDKISLIVQWQGDTDNGVAAE